jgi:transposase
VIKIQLNTEEVKLLESHYSKAICRLIRERAHANLLSNDGYQAGEIARILRRSEDTVREWLNNFNESRVSSIFHKYDDNLNASKFTDEQKKEIKEVLSKQPKENLIPKEFWTLPVLKEYLSAKFGVVYESLRSYHYLLEYSGLSWKLPSTFDLRRNDKQIQERMIVIEKELETLKKEENTVILSADEARINFETEIRRAWLKKGEKTVLKVSRDKQGQSYFGAWNHKTKICHTFRMPWQNQTHTIAVLKKLLLLYPGKKVVILWDNAKWHKGKLLRAELGKGNSLENIHLINYAPYAPDLNPQEHVWKFGKESISNTIFKSFELLKEHFENQLNGKIFDYEIPEFVLR